MHAETSTASSLRLAGVFGDHMVLQRNQPIRLWGWAEPGERVTIRFRGHTVNVTTDAQGRWSGPLRSAPAGGPHTLTVQGRNQRLTVQDVLVGEVWLCGGQSNMERTVAEAQDAEREMARSHHPLLRHVKVPHRTALLPQQDSEALSWKASTPQTAGEFSAVGYYFARELQRTLRVPIGLVNVTWWGTHAETWMAREALAATPTYAQAVATTPTDLPAWQARIRARDEARIRSWQGTTLSPLPREPAAWASPELADGDWPQLVVPGYWEDQGLPDFDGYVWFRREFALTPADLAAPATLHLGTVDDCDETWINGQPVGKTCGWDQQRHYPVPQGLLRAGRNVIAVRVTDTGGGGGFYGEASRVRLESAAGSLSLAGSWKARIEAALEPATPGPNDGPSLAYNGMLAPLVGLPMRGVIWYQGESNVPRAAEYPDTFARLITDWRARWRLGPFGFYFVQLASYLPLERNTLRGSDWAELREAQRQTLALPRTGMAVTTDVGDANDIHPRNKQAVGQRLARLALHREYGIPLEDSGPTLRRVRVEPRRMVLDFDHAAGGLVARSPDAKTVQGFAVAGADGNFQQARAVVRASSVVVDTTTVAQARYVRFGWVANPEENNLFNRAGLPASPFRTDALHLTTEGRHLRW